MKRTSKIRSKAQLDLKLQQLHSLESQIDLMVQEAEAIRDQIKECMGDDEIIETENYIVRWTRFESSRFDTAAFRKSHPDMFDEFVNCNEARRFSYRPN